MKHTVRFFTFLTLLALAFSAAGVTPAHAAGICYVNASASGGANNGTSWADAYTDLQSALAPAATCTEIWVAGGTYIPGALQTDTFQLKNGVAIYGGFAGTESLLTERILGSYESILSGDTEHDGTYHVVTGSGTDSSAVLDGFTIFGGYAIALAGMPNSMGGGMYNVAGSPTLANITFDSNYAKASGGGMYNENSSPTLTNVTFSWNIGELVGGGGMYNYNSSPTLTNVEFSHNRSNAVGGGMLNDNSSPTLTDVTFTVNRAYQEGGGMFNGESSPTLTNVTFSGNLAKFDSNVESQGGGMANENSNPTLTNVTFSNNTVGITAGINKAGGGMYNSGSSPTLTNVTFSGNTGTNGGGMYNYWNSSPTLTNVTFSGNSATSDGGGMLNFVDSSPTLTNVTFSGNTASGIGGGMYNAPLWEHNVSPTLTNVIIANSVGGDCVNGEFNTLNASSANNLIEDSVNACGLTNGTNGDIVGSDPLLGALGSYGGDTQTFPLLPGSPAINAGNAAACAAAPVDGIDQRGVSHVGTCDIGSFESQGFSMSISGGDGQSAAINSAFTNPLQVTVSSSYSEPVDGGKVTFTAPASGASTNPTVNTATIASGAASQSVTANGTAGGPYTVTASASGAASVDFSLTNLQTYTVTFYGNGSDGGSMSPQISAVAANLTANAFTRAGYTFASWNTQPDGLGTSYTDGQSYSFSADLDLYAQWTAIDYTVTYALGGGTGSVPTDGNTYHIGDTVNVLFAPLPTRTGYTFAGWSDGVTTYTSGGTESFSMGAGNVTLAAQWTVNQYTISFEENGGSAVADITQDYGSAVTAPADPTRVGYTFGGWYTDDGTFNNAYTFTTMPAENVTLYARWTVLPNHTVTFDTNGGTGSMSPQTTNVPTALTLNTFTRTGYSFTGWGTDPGGPVVYADGATYDFTADVTLYAQWTALPNHTVTFNANGGTGTMTPQVNNQPAALNSNTFTRAGYSFSGWNTAANGSGTSYANGATYDFSADVTLYAQWTALPRHTVTFRSTGTQDGWILESSEKSNKGGTLNSAATAFRLGDDTAKKQYRSILSFATGAALPNNAVITKVTLKVKKQGIIGGGNPVSIFKGFMVDIKKGIFGTTALQAADFQATASKTYGPFTTTLSGGWYTINLTAGKAYVNKLGTASGLTQIRLRFKLDDNNNGIANYLSLYSGNAGTASRPQLIVQYYIP